MVQKMEMVRHTKRILNVNSTDAVVSSYKSRILYNYVFQKNDAEKKM